jgi:preprotein translocase subunit YajC
VIEQILGGLVAQQAPEGGAAGGLISMLPILLMFGVIYFLMIRPQQKQAKQHRTYVDSLKAGDEVVTNSGIYGRIVSIAEPAVTLEIARDVKIRVLKAQIAGPQPGAAAELTTAKKD